MAKKKDPAQSIIDAAMSLAAAIGWRRLTLSAVADKAGLSLADVIQMYPDKYAIVTGLQDRVDAEMLVALQDLGPAEGGPRDRLFELIMERFDLLVPYRTALGEIAHASMGDPMAACFLPRMKRTMTRLLESSGIAVSGVKGVMRIKGLGLVYADAFRIWLKDDSPDLTKTMAQLDKGLRRAEQAEMWMSGKRSPAKSEPEVSSLAGDAKTAPAK